MVTRRTFTAVGLAASAQAQTYPIVDIHQHVPYTGRSAPELVEHQRRMGIGKTVLLPAGRAYALAAGVGGNDAAMALAKQHPGSYFFFANELPDIQETRATLERYLKSGAIGIGEQKYHVASDSRHIQLIASIAQEYSVPVLLHFEHGAYNLNFERFHRILESYKRVNFIGHAQTWWGNIDRKHEQSVLYPKTNVAPGGLTDKWLSDYPNMFGDLSAGSGLNALLRDEDNAREFLKRHQDKLLYGSDCSDRKGEGEECSGSKQIAAIRRLLPDSAAQRKIFHDNAARIMKLG
jgi:predicted TIM-barrel fold metal-dependent hydrolase